MFYFNTSYVTVQLLCLLWAFCCLLDFNTSYVTVQLVNPFSQIFALSNFNTSYVTVQHISDAVRSTYIFISIHLMLRFNMCNFTTRVRCYKFQYILCYGSTLLKLSVIYKIVKISIHLMLRFNINLPLEQLAEWAFQYILCYGSTN